MCTQSFLVQNPEILLQHLKNEVLCRCIHVHSPLAGMLQGHLVLQSISSIGSPFATLWQQLMLLLEMATADWVVPIQSGVATPGSLVNCCILWQALQALSGSSSWWTVFVSHQLLPPPQLSNGFINSRGRKQNGSSEEGLGDKSPLRHWQTPLQCNVVLQKIGLWSSSCLKFLEYNLPIAGTVKDSQKWLPVDDPFANPSNLFGGR